MAANPQGLGWRGFTGIAEESLAASFGTPSAASTYIDFDSESMDDNENIIYPNSIINSPETVVAIQGRRAVTGSLAVLADVNSMNWFCKWGNRSTASAAYPPIPTGTSATAAAGGSLAVGTFKYQLATVYNLTGTTKYWISSLTATFNGTTAGANLTLTVAWTLPTAPTGYTIFDTLVFRSVVSGSSVFYLTNVGSNSATSYSDTGSVSLSTTAAPTIVTYQATHKASNNQQKTFSMECGKDGFSLQYYGCKLGDLSFSIPTSGLVTCTVGGIVAQNVQRIASTNPTYNHLAPIPGHNAVAYLQPANGTQTLFVRNQQAQFKISNNLKPVQSQNGSALIRELDEGNRTITGSFDVQLDSYDQVTYALSAQTMWIQYLCWGAPLDGGVFSVTAQTQTCVMWPSQLTIDVPDIIYKGMSVPTPQKSGKLIQKIAFDRALTDSVKNYSIALQVVSLSSTLADAA